MPEHYPKNTVQAAFWCAQCRRDTPHRIDRGRRGPCLVCIDKLTQQGKATPARPPAPEQFKLF
jgi:hypothetical protein